MNGPALLDRIDRVIAELQAIRAAVAADLPDEKGVATTYTLGADDFAPANLVEISTAVERFNRPADSLRYLCRNEACGKKIGGRWLASVPRIQRRLNGG